MCSLLLFRHHCCNFVYCGFLTLLYFYQQDRSNLLTRTTNAHDYGINQQNYKRSQKSQRSYIIGARSLISGIALWW